MEKIILYHGSRGGIVGKIEPKSRLRCDFGAGLYMGTNPDQAKPLVLNDQAPYFYKLELDLSEFPADHILRLDGMEESFSMSEIRFRRPAPHCSPQYKTM